MKILWTFWVLMTFWLSQHLEFPSSRSSKVSIQEEISEKPIRLLITFKGAKAQLAALSVYKNYWAKTMKFKIFTITVNFLWAATLSMSCLCYQLDRWIGSHFPQICLSLPRIVILGILSTAIFQTIVGRKCSCRFLQIQGLPFLVLLSEIDFRPSVTDSYAWQRTQLDEGYIVFCSFWPHFWVRLNCLMSFI